MGESWLLGNVTCINLSSRDCSSADKRDRRFKNVGASTMSKVHWARGGSLVKYDVYTLLIMNVHSPLARNAALRLEMAGSVGSALKYQSFRRKQLVPANA